MKVWLDLETYSAADLPSKGPWSYAEDPTTEILLVGYAIDDGPVKVWDVTENTACPSDLHDALFVQKADLCVFNAGFEIPVLEAVFGWTFPPERVHDVQAKALSLGHPASLGALSFALGLRA